MDNLPIRWIIRLGVPGLFLYLLYGVIRGWNFSFGGLNGLESFVVVLAVIGASCFIAYLIFRPTHETRSDYSLVERLRQGLPSPEDNLRQIESIANSTDPRKIEYLNELSASRELSFMEREAVRIALDNLRSGNKVENLKQKARARELERLTENAQMFPDASAQQVYVGLSYWRYVNRPNHRDYVDIEKILAEATAHHDFTPEAMRISREIMTRPPVSR
jgi:hypothetical protein